MSVGGAVVELKKQVLGEIVKVGERGGSAAEVQALSRLLSKVEEIEREEIERIAGALEGRSVAQTQPPIHPNAVPGLHSHEPGRLGAAGISALSPKAWGKMQRERVASRLHLTQIRGTLYRTPTGRQVGIAPARESKPGYWFLGLPENPPCDFVILLCESAGRTAEFDLPREQVARIWPSLSRSPSGVKFNVYDRSGHYELQVPGIGRIDIGQFRDAYHQIA